MERILCADVMADRLSTWLRSGTTIDALEPVEIDYAPGRHCQVMWRVWIAGQPRIAVVAISADGSRERAAEHLVAPPATEKDAPVERLCGLDQDLAASLHWFPYDPALPALASELGHLLTGDARPTVVGVTAATDLAYRPAERAVRRIGDTVVKWYADAAAYERVLDGFAWAGQVLGGAAVPLLEADPVARMIRQPFVAGDGIERDGAVVAGWDAGATLARLHRSDPPMALCDRSATSVLDLADDAARLVSAIRPDLAVRVAALMDHLATTIPSGVGVPSHGDFNVSQMIRVADGSLVVLDFDELCRAAPAYDVAAYIANIVGGRAADADEAALVMDGILAGYGHRPDDLGWYLSALILRRARSPFRLQKARWPERVDAGLAIAEAALAW
jgi:Phosphotransferase enzyme family